MNLKKRALKLGATDFGNSKKKGKRFYVVYNNKIINFGSKNGSTFIDHHDEKKRKAWLARHMKIKNKQGQHVYKLKTSASYWSLNLLWT